MVVALGVTTIILREADNENIGKGHKHIIIRQTMISKAEWGDFLYFSIRERSDVNIKSVTKNLLFATLTLQLTAKNPAKLT